MPTAPAKRADDPTTLCCPGCGTRIPISEALVQQLVAERVAAERPALEARARSAAAGELETELRDARAALAEKDERIRVQRETELALRRGQRELEEKARELELDVARRVDAERAKIREDAQRRAEEEHRLRDAEKELRLQEALRVNDELRRKLEQGSQQTQGEAVELALEELLAAAFPLDSIEPVAKGVRGADVLQRVRTRSGVGCGSILWESKQTKHWSPGWIEKLKDDQRDAKAELAILVSAALPKDLQGFGARDGVWICEPRLALALASALRGSLCDLANARRALAGRDEVRDALFAYVTGPEFRRRVEAIARSFADMHSDLDEEKRAAARRWARREKQLARVLESTGAMYGELEGLLGPSLPPVPALAEGGAPDADAGPYEIAAAAP